MLALNGAAAGLFVLLGVGGAERADGEAFVTEGRHVVGEEAHAFPVVLLQDDIHRHRFAGGEVHEMLAGIDLHFQRLGAGVVLPIEGEHGVALDIDLLAEAVEAAREQVAGVEVCMAWRNSP